MQMSPAPYVEPFHRVPLVVVEMVRAVGRGKKHQGLMMHLHHESPFVV